MESLRPGGVTLGGASAGQGTERFGEETTDSGEDGFGRSGVTRSGASRAVGQGRGLKTFWLGKVVPGKAGRGTDGVVRAL